MRGIGLVCAVMALAAGNVAAQETDAAAVGDGALEIGVFTGALYAASDHEFYDPAVAQQVGLGAANLEFGLRVGYSILWWLGVEAEAMLIPTETDAGDRATLSGFRGHVVVQNPGRVTPFLVAGGGMMAVTVDDDGLTSDTDAVGHVGLGVKYRLKPNLPIRLDAHWLRAPAANKPTGTNHFEVVLGASWTFDLSAPPKPKDKIIVKVVDEDGDGILDDKDKCPAHPENVNGYQDGDGCPEKIPDSDGDGLSDVDDKCVAEAEDMDGYADEDGCPDTDNDSDGVVDQNDDCPMQAGVIENRGCTDSDRDGDGVVDRRDNCPDEVGTAAYYGCADKQLVALTDDRIKTLDRVYFKQARARVRRRSRKLLDNVAAVIKSHPEIPKIRVEGHTDNTGDTDQNKKLSQLRAERVVKYLIKQGVGTERLEAVGFGQEKPLLSNEDELGRMANRRVEFNFVGR